MRLTNEGIEFRDSFFAVILNLFILGLFIFVISMFLKAQEYLFAAAFIAFSVFYVWVELWHWAKGCPLVKITPQAFYFKGGKPILLADILSIDAAVKRHRRSKAFVVFIEVKNPANYPDFKRKFLFHGVSNAFSFDITALSKKDRERLLIEFKNILPNIYVALNFK